MADAFFVSVPDAGENTLEVKLYGAIVYAGAAEAVKPVSSVPGGGIGTLTTAILCENALKAAGLQTCGKVVGRCATGWGNRTVGEFVQEAGSAAALAAAPDL
ncbi:hypothetical protein QJ48_28840 [Paenibacillus sp. A3]|nr:hypothetical protein QJ48_28840 [Paenibacillus sp. A3]